MNAQDARDTIKVLGNAGIVSYTLDDALVKRVVTALGITVPKEKENFLFFVPRRDAAYVIILPRDASRRDEEIKWLAMRFDCKRYEASPFAKVRSLRIAMQTFQSAIEHLAGFAECEREPLPGPIEHARN